MITATIVGVVFFVVSFFIAGRILKAYYRNKK